MRPLSAPPAALSAAVRRSARPGAAETAAAPAAILLNAERREIFVFIILAQVEFRGEYTPLCCARVKQDSHCRGIAQNRPAMTHSSPRPERPTMFDSTRGRRSLTQ